MPNTTVHLYRRDTGDTATVELTVRGWFHSLTLNGQQIVAANDKPESQAKIRQALVDLFSIGWRTVGAGTSLPYTLRFAIGEAGSTSRQTLSDSRALSICPACSASCVARMARRGSRVLLARSTLP